MRERHKPSVMEGTDTSEKLSVGESYLGSLLINHYRIYQLGVCTVIHTTKLGAFRSNAKKISMFESLKAFLRIFTHFHEFSRIFKQFLQKFEFKGISSYRPDV